jgi:hypothetical protein
MITWRRIAVTFAVWAGLVLPGWAGVVIVETHTPATGEARKTTLYLEGNRIRVESEAARGGQVFIFDGDKDVFYMIEPASKSYREMTRADLEKMAAQVTDVMAQMQEKLKNLPPEQRAMVEQMMKKRGIGAASPAPALTFKKVASGRKVNQWSCDLYEGSAGDVKAWEVCAAEPSALGLSASDFAALTELAGFFKGLLPGGSDQMFRVAAVDEQGYSGVPVSRVMFQNGQPQGRFELTDVRRESVPPTLFEVPAGFTKQAMPTMPAMPPRG